MEELAEESRRLKSLISAKEAEEAEIEQVRREGRRLVALGNSKKSEADKAASRAAKAAEYDEAWQSLATLEQAEYEAAMALKAEGNVLFGAGKHAEAIAKYDAALSQYGAAAARRVSQSVAHSLTHSLTTTLLAQAHDPHDDLICTSQGHGGYSRVGRLENREYGMLRRPCSDGAQAAAPEWASSWPRRRSSSRTRPSAACAPRRGRTRRARRAWRCCSTRSTPRACSGAPYLLLAAPRLTARYLLQPHPAAPERA